MPSGGSGGVELDDDLIAAVTGQSARWIDPSGTGG